MANPTAELLVAAAQRRMGSMFAAPTFEEAAQMAADHITEQEARGWVVEGEPIERPRDRLVSVTMIEAAGNARAAQLLAPRRPDDPVVRLTDGDSQ